MKQPYIYIMAKKYRGTMYTGVSSNLLKRIYEHKTEFIEGFTKVHGIKNLVWFEAHETMESAIIREKLVKRWKREWKYELVEKTNPTWKDLYFGLLEQTPHQVRGDDVGVRGIDVAVQSNKVRVLGDELMEVE